MVFIAQLNFSNISVVSKVAVPLQMSQRQTSATPVCMPRTLVRVHQSVWRPVPRILLLLRIRPAKVRPASVSNVKGDTVGLELSTPDENGLRS